MNVLISVSNKSNLEKIAIIASMLKIPIFYKCRVIFFFGRDLIWIAPYRNQAF